jgi:hypothetical protein
MVWQLHYRGPSAARGDVHLEFYSRIKRVVPNRQAFLLYCFANAEMLSQDSPVSAGEINATASLELLNLTHDAWAPTTYFGSIGVNVPPQGRI